MRRPLLYFGVGAAVFIFASLGWFRSVELFPWLFGPAWALSGILRLAFTRRSMSRAPIALTIAGTLLSALAPAAHVTQFRVARGLWQREALTAFETTGTPQLVFAHVVNNRRGTWTGNSAYDGITLLSFWATWCAPCLSEIPLLERFSNSHDPSVARVVGFTTFYEATDEASRREELGHIEQVLRERGVSYPTLVAVGATRV